MKQSENSSYNRLSQKYNTPESSIKQMVNDGVISCTWTMKEELYEMYTKMRATSPGMTHTDICYAVGEIRGVAPNTVANAVNKLK